MAEKGTPESEEETTQRLVTELDACLRDHGDWLAALQGALVCRQPPGPEHLAEDSHLRCRFGQWYLRNQGSWLVDQPAFRAFGKTHEEMHVAARGLARLSVGQAAIPRQTYDAFIDRVAAFNAQGRRFERAFSIAHSNLDPLTGLQNRKAMMTEIFRERERSLRNRTPFSVAIADLDRFKLLNDAYGHRAGDQVLAGAAQVFLAHLRPFDGIFRYGGEEFLFSLPHADRERAVTILNRLRNELAQTPTELADGTLLWTTASFGVAAMEAEATVEELVDRADKALYAAKARGRNRVATWPLDGD
ncbi:MAG: diguanylate cyclase [Proteobacteria bacterium]|nr:diguanylate cyclase [Pseudomonadota bacterium]